MLIRSALLVLGCCCVLAGQDTETYVSFLAQVARLGSGGNAVMLNGQPSDVVSSRLQDEVGLAANEAEVLRAVANDFHAKATAIDGALRRATWERRMAAIAGEALSPEAELLAEVTHRRAQLTIRHRSAAR
jgi:hypothetical protein